jgi:hypothetical protein
MKRHRGECGDDRRPSWLGSIDWIVDEISAGAERSARGDQIVVLRVSLKIRCHERTVRDNTQPIRARVVERRTGERRAIAIALERGWDLGVDEAQSTSIGSVVEHCRALGRADLEAMGRGVMGDVWSLSHVMLTGRGKSSYLLNAFLSASAA